MNGLFVAAREVCKFFDSRRWRYCIIGGIALLRWGNPRATKDVDFTFWPGFENEEEIVDDFFAHFRPRTENARSPALATRVLLLYASNGAPFDVSMAGFPFEEEFIERATNYKFSSEFEGRTCSAEDLIVMKAFADRPQDWVDIADVIVRQGSALDWDAMMERLSGLAELKEADLVLKLERLRPA